MGENAMAVCPPALPALEFFSVPDHTILTRDRAALLSYDPATRSGFVYVIESRRWSITAPIEFDQFAMLVALAGYTIADTEDAARWVNACRHGARRGETMN